MTKPFPGGRFLDVAEIASQNATLKHSPPIKKGGGRVTRRASFRSRKCGRACEFLPPTENTPRTWKHSDPEISFVPLEPKCGHSSQGGLVPIAEEAPEGSPLPFPRVEERAQWDPACPRPPASSSPGGCISVYWYAM
jgi:hypothetical protein